MLWAFWVPVDYALRRPKRFLREVTGISWVLSEVLTSDSWLHLWLRFYLSPCLSTAFLGVIFSFSLRIFSRLEKLEIRKWFIFQPASPTVFYPIWILANKVICFLKACLSYSSGSHLAGKTQLMLSGFCLEVSLPNFVSLLVIHISVFSIVLGDRFTGMIPHLFPLF